jgi:hypothetical protein
VPSHGRPPTLDRPLTLGLLLLLGRPLTLDPPVSYPAILVPSDLARHGCLTSRASAARVGRRSAGAGIPPHPRLAAGSRGKARIAAPLTATRFADPA